MKVGISPGDWYACNILGKHNKMLFSNFTLDKLGMVKEFLSTYPEHKDLLRISMVAYDNFDRVLNSHFAVHRTMDCDYTQVWDDFRKFKREKENVEK